jgi:60S ribosomal subunit assembly/export protein LOC1
MAPTVPSKKSMGSKGSTPSGKPSGATRNISSATKRTKPTGKAPPPKQVKPKPSKGPTPKKKTKIYTDKELDLPALNMITPAGVQKPRGKKKGKIFVDDQVRLLCYTFYLYRSYIPESRKA